MSMDVTQEAIDRLRGMGTEGAAELAGAIERVRSEYVAVDLERLVSIFEREFEGRGGGFVDGINTAINHLQNRIAELRGSLGDGAST